MRLTRPGSPTAAAQAWRRLRTRVGATAKCGLSSINKRLIFAVLLNGDRSFTDLARLMRLHPWSVPLTRSAGESGLTVVYSDSGVGGEGGGGDDAAAGGQEEGDPAEVVDMAGFLSVGT